MWWLLACATEPAPVLPPEVHSWEEEGALVAQGLGDVERLWKGGQREAARTLAERVYTERWEPRLEPAARKLAGPLAGAEVEYAFGQLLVELEGSGTRLGERVDTVEKRVLGVAAEAARAYPPPTAAGAAPPPPLPAEGSKPIVPEARPAWETDPAAATKTVEIPEKK